MRASQGRRILLLGGLLLAGCPEEKKTVLVVDELICPDPETQIRRASGYCDCKEGFGVFDPDTDECISCTPSCEGRECGNDGCDGQCGTCSAGFICTDGACEVCTPFCDGQECGPDGCGGTCGSCGPGDVCIENECVDCVPNCNEKSCGPDGCGGVCGTCDLDAICVESSCESQTAGLPCGSTVTSCNCGYVPPSAFPGAVREERMCDSALVVFSLCNGFCLDPFGYPTGTYPWQETCACQ